MTTGCFRAPDTSPRPSRISFYVVNQNSLPKARFTSSVGRGGAEGSISEFKGIQIRGRKREAYPIRSAAFEQEC